MPSKTITRTCEHCGKLFYVPKHRIGQARYCSYTCSNAHREQPVEVTCVGCGAVFVSIPSAVRRGRSYCTRECWIAHGGDVRRRLAENRDIDPDTGCWNWTRGLTSSGYGKVKVSGRTYMVHRLAAAEYSGFSIDSPLRVLHRCDNPRCFNPKHLFIGTDADNVKDMYAKGRACVGSRKSDAILTESDVPVIRERMQSGERVADIARDYGVSKAAIYNIKSGRSWSHVR